MDLKELSTIDFTFPPLPTTLGEILEIVSSDSQDVNMDDLIQLIERDPAMTAYVLRQANSSYYAVRQYITRVDKAVTFLGFSTVSRIALGAALKQAFAYLESPATRQIFGYVMQCSLATALFTREVTDFMKLSATHTTFTGGMLFQVGRLVLLHAMEKDYVPLWHKGADEGSLHVPTLEEERQTFGSTYVQVGGATAEKWNFPEELVAVIAHHQDPAQVMKPHLKLFAYIVGASGCMAEVFCQGVSPEACDALLLTDDRYKAVRGLAELRKIDVNDLVAMAVENGPIIAEFAKFALT